MNYESEKLKNFKRDFKKRCFQFSLNIIRLCSKLRINRNCWPILDQLIRSATSVGANITEGGYAASKKDFINYFQISVKSSSETEYWLSILKEITTNEKQTISELLDESIQLRKIISTIILNTKIIKIFDS